jgi:hypothetical protein
MFLRSNHRKKDGEEQVGQKQSHEIELQTVR